MNTIDCYCDFDPPIFYTSKIVKAARKVHTCEECRGPIMVGETYRKVIGMWEPRWLSTFKECERCVDLQTWIKNNVPCFCPVHGDMDEQMKQAVDVAYARARSEVIGLRFGFLRRKAKRDKLNAARRKELTR